MMIEEMKRQVNPLIQISGFLELQVKVNANTIHNVSSQGMLYRGIEQMVLGQSPKVIPQLRLNQTISESLGLIQAIEKVISLKPTKNHYFIRHFLLGCEFILNHMNHFYLYVFPDYVSGIQMKETIQDYRLSERLNNKLCEHYELALQKIQMVENIFTLIKINKTDHSMFTIGGVNVTFDISKWLEVKSILTSLQDFVYEVMLTDIEIISKVYDDYFYQGRTTGQCLSAGVFTEHLNDFYVHVQPGIRRNDHFELLDEEWITKQVIESWHHETDYMKAPHYKKTQMEVGPLSRLWLKGSYRKGFSSMDRLIARVLETKQMIPILIEMIHQINFADTINDRESYIKDGIGSCIVDTPSGVLGSFIQIENQIITNYSTLKPTTWNFPFNNHSGIIDQALNGTYLKHPNEATELTRIIHAFDPSITCHAHLIGDDVNRRIRLI